MRIHVEPRPAEQLTDTQVSRLMEIARQEAALIDQMTDAMRASQTDEVLRLAKEITDLEDMANDQTK